MICAHWSIGCGWLQVCLLLRADDTPTLVRKHVAECLNLLVTHVLPEGPPVDLRRRAQRSLQAQLGASAAQVPIPPSQHNQLLSAAAAQMPSQSPHIWQVVTIEWLLKYWYFGVMGHNTAQPLLSPASEPDCMWMYALPTA